jgi:hypothetical protein
MGGGVSKGRTGRDRSVARSGMTFLRIVIPLQAFWGSMIFFRKPASTFRDHAQGSSA